MRIRRSTGVLIVAFVAAVVATIAMPRGTGAWAALLRFAATLTLFISTVGLLLLGINSVRDTILGRRRSSRRSFPAGRCHACGYDTSSLVRGIVACPECGTILASIPDGVRAERDDMGAASDTP
ncbi:MAG: hypothetical protein KF838_01165 [Phycisphaeraceae bacterium]|nr:MAG: hypothetical protein KF838_01165 [Phycisphaeraceae bacterium]